MAVDSLTEADRALLDFEGRWWPHVGAKEAAIPKLFGCTVVRYYQRLAALITRPAAAEYAPVLVHRLQRIAG